MNTIVAAEAAVVVAAAASCPYGWQVQVWVQERTNLRFGEICAPVRAVGCRGSFVSLLIG